jgi:hypothetical protein
VKASAGPRCAEIEGVELIRTRLLQLLKAGLQQLQILKLID